MVNGYHIPGTWYYTRCYALRGVLVRVRLAPFVLSCSCGGHIDMLLAVMSTSFICDTTHCCTPFPDIAWVRIPVKYMPTATRTSLQSIFYLFVVPSLYHMMNKKYIRILVPTLTPLPSISSL